MEDINSFVKKNNEEYLLTFDWALGELVKFANAGSYNEVNNLINMIIIDLKNFNINFRTFLRYVDVLGYSSLSSTIDSDKFVALVNALVNANVVEVLPEKKDLLNSYKKILMQRAANLNPVSR